VHFTLYIYIYTYIYKHTQFINAAAGHITQCQSPAHRLVSLALRYLDDTPPHIRHRFTDPKFRIEFLRKSFFKPFLRVGSCTIFNDYSQTITLKYKLLAHSTYGQNNWLVTSVTRGRVIRLLTPNMDHCQFFFCHFTTKFTVLRLPVQRREDAVALVYLHDTQMNK
jgi:hypothetical protein